VLAAVNAALLSAVALDAPKEDTLITGPALLAPPPLTGTRVTVNDEDRSTEAPLTCVPVLV